MPFSFYNIPYCAACHSRTSNIEKHLVETHGIVPRGGLSASRWYVLAIEGLTAWVKTPEDLLHYLPFDESDAEIIRNKAATFHLEACKFSVRVPGEWIHWTYRNNVAKISYIGDHWLRFECYDEPVGQITQRGDIYHWSVVGLNGIAYTERTARMNMLMALKCKYGSYHYQYAGIRAALFDTLPEPIAEAIDAVVFQTFNSNQLRNYASQAYINVRVKEINPAKKSHGNVIPPDILPTEWERIAWS